MKVAQEQGISIPEELKLLVMTELILWKTSQLFTIQQPLKDIACLLVDLLLRKIEKVPTTGYFLPVHFLQEKAFNTVK